MKTIDTIYINGQFVKPYGNELFELINPSNKQRIGQVVLADERDANAAIAAARAAYADFSQTGKEQRMLYSQRLHEAVAARSGELVETMIEEYGGTRQMCEGDRRRQHRRHQTERDERDADAAADRMPA